MKVISIDQNLPKVSFRGYKPVKDDYGFKAYEFNFPFDETQYNCYLELYNVEKDENGNYRILDIIPNADNGEDKLPLRSGSNIVDLASSYFISNDTPFAYHYRLVDKNGHVPAYEVDAGDIIDNRHNGAHEIYNIVTQSGSAVSRGGSMKLVPLDNFKPGYIYNQNMFGKQYIIKDDDILNKAMKSYKHFSNKLGGTMAGLEKAVDDGEFDGYSSIISLPVFTDDTVSSHGYWNKNCMQIAQSLGNINNYASLQRKMFAKGLNFVSDGAFVNEGLEGVHFKSILKWGDKSPYFNWFRSTGLQNSAFFPGVFSKNQEFVSHKLVNSPYSYDQKSDGSVHISKNKDYNPKAPTYVQIFDNRLVSEEQRNDKKHLIKSYDILSPEYLYEINTHNDTVIPYSFEINPKTYNSSIKNLNEYNKNHDNTIQMDDIRGTRFLTKFENFELEGKIESGYDTWDANTDIPKLNYVYSHTDTEAMKNLDEEQRAERLEVIRRNNVEVQDYVVTSGAYWTQKTDDILRLYIAQNLKNIELQNPGKVKSMIEAKVKDGVFPKCLNLNTEIVRNILNGDYETKREFRDDTYKNQVKMGLMNFPLDTIELGDNLTGTLSSPYISKRATHEDEIGVSRYDLDKKGNPHLIDEYKEVYEKTQQMYDNELTGFALDILDKVQGKLSAEQQFSSNKDTSLYGKYVLPIITAEIAKFAVIKALQPDAAVYVDKETGEIGYDYNALKEVSLQTLGIYGASPEDEAESLIGKIRSGITKISDSDKKLLTGAIAKSLQGTSAGGFALADVIIDRSGAGLDWRIDAAKDIADIDALRSGKTDFEYSWQNVIDFWKKFNDAVLKINPNAYLVAEVTDEKDLHNRGNGAASAKYPGYWGFEDVRRKTLNETGFTAYANYNFFFTDLMMLFGKSAEYNKYCMEYSVNDSYFGKRLFEKMRLSGKKEEGAYYLSSSNLPSLLYSYTFAGNHDKPRAVHTLALDMAMFFTDLTDVNNRDHRERAYRIINDKFDGRPVYDLDSFDFGSVSPKAVAMAEAVRTAYIDTLNSLRDADPNSKFAQNHTVIFEDISKAVSQMAKGQYLGRNFEADAFAAKPFDLTIDAVMEQMKYIDAGFPLDDKECKAFKDKTFERMVEPAMSRLAGMMKYLVALPGKPTLFAGDDLGATGFETKTKNIYQQNRSFLHYEWLSEKSKAFIKKYYDEVNRAMALRSRPELDALNNGAPFMLPMQYAKDGTAVTAILRQNTDGKMAVSLLNPAGINHNPREKYEPKTVYLDRIELSEKYIDDNAGMIGLKHGLKEGIEFVSAIDKDDVYKVVKEGGRYYLKHENNSVICVTDSTLILYHVPRESQVAFMGKADYKPQFSFVSKAYEKALV